MLRNWYKKPEIAERLEHWKQQVALRGANAYLAHALTDPATVRHLVDKPLQDERRIEQLELTRQQRLRAQFELERLQNPPKLNSPWAQSQDDEDVELSPLPFIRRILGENVEPSLVLSGIPSAPTQANAPTPGQIAICDGLTRFTRLHVKSGNNLGKSHIIARLALWHLRKDSSTTIVTASEGRVVSDILMPRIGALANSIGIPGVLKRSIHPDLDDPEHALLSWSAEKAEGASGHHPHGSLMVLVDEVQGMGEHLFQALEGMASSEGNIIVLFGNPLYLDGPFHRIGTDDSPHWGRFTLSALDHPNIIYDRLLYPSAIAPDQIRAWRAEHGEDSDFWRTRVLGEFPKEDPEGREFFSQQNIAAAQRPIGEPDNFARYLAQ